MHVPGTEEGNASAYQPSTSLPSVGTHLCSHVFYACAVCKVWTFKLNL